MASRKRKPETPQMGLGFTGTSLPPEVTIPRFDPGLVQIPILASSPEADLDLESFDDYDDQRTHNDVPRLRLVDPPIEVSIIVEAVGDTFEVSRLRDGGTTVACVMYTRKELEELIRRATSALEM